MPWERGLVGGLQDSEGPLKIHQMGATKRYSINVAARFSKDMYPLFQSLGTHSPSCMHACWGILRSIQRSHLKLGERARSSGSCHCPIVTLCTSVNPLYIHSLHGQLGQQTRVRKVGTWTSGMVL